MDLQNGEWVGGWVGVCMYGQRFWCLRVRRAICVWREIFIERVGGFDGVGEKFRLEKVWLDVDLKVKML